jgi:hypothetical protein
MRGVTLATHVPITEALPLSSLRTGMNSDLWGEGEAAMSLSEVQGGGALYSFDQIFGEPL